MVCSRLKYEGFIYKVDDSMIENLCVEMLGITPYISGIILPHINVEYLIQEDTLYLHELEVYTEWSNVENINSQVAFDISVEHKEIFDYVNGR